MSSIIKAKAGDCVNSIACAQGLSPLAVWNASENREMHTLRECSGVLSPSDQIHLQGLREGGHDGASEKRHRFRKCGVWVRIRLCNGGEPVVNEPYILAIGADSYTGKTDEDGRFEHLIQPAELYGTLRLTNQSVVLRVHLGALDPWDSLSGAQGRLRNLGFDPGPIDGKMGTKTTAALSTFQAREALDVTGAIDDQTATKLKEIHGC